MASTFEDDTGGIEVIDPATEERIGSDPDTSVALARRAHQRSSNGIRRRAPAVMKPAERA